MDIQRLLIANRGEIAVRIAHTAAELGISTIGIYGKADAYSLHVKKVDEAILLKGKGVTAYLDIEQIINIAREQKVDAIHPGYGFLSENHDFARACEVAGIQFIGPSSEVLGKLGNKYATRKLAKELDIPIVPGSEEGINVEAAQSFFLSLEKGSSMLLKAAHGGGGRGMRVVHDIAQLETAFQQAETEAFKAFGSGELYVEKYLPKVRHIEVQVVGDGDDVIDLGERECSLQRRNQKVIEMAPAPGLSKNLRQKIIEAALHLAQKVSYQSIGTFEFLVEGDTFSDTSSFYFIEANPRIQVEHTVTEEVCGLDLVEIQILLAKGLKIKDLDALIGTKAKGAAIQLRINMERMDEQGNVIPTSGKLSQFSFPMNSGIRVDTYAYPTYSNSPFFDSLLAKVIVYSKSNDHQRLIEKAYRTACEVHIDGIGTNLAFLQNILKEQAVCENRFHTRFIEESLSSLLSPEKGHQELFFPLKNAQKLVQPDLKISIDEDASLVKSPMPGSIISVEIKEGQRFQKGQTLFLIDSMKMENVILAEEAGMVGQIFVENESVIQEGQMLFSYEPSEDLGETSNEKEEVDLDHIRPDLQQMVERRNAGLDEFRPKAVELRRKRGQYTARENITALVDKGSFSEYGAFAIAAQRTRRSEEELIKNTPADGFVSGVASINGLHFSDEKSRCVVMAYDFTVLAGTQGTMNHQKLDRMIELAEKWKIPVVIFAEGGGGRPGDVDVQTVAGLHITSFVNFARLSGQVPVVSIVSRYCFAGNAALLGCADVIIATKNASIGMGGPAMIEGGGLGTFHPKDVGPVSFQATNGVIDVLVEDEMEAVSAAKKYLSYFQGPISTWEVNDQRILRRLVPENRRRVYDIRKVIQGMVDKDSVLELRKGFGVGMITAFVRVEGFPFGLIANNPKHLAGAINSDGADKASRFMQLCDAFGIPIITLCDTPGIMVGPDAERSGTVRHASRMFITGASLKVPMFTIVLRKGYGLGAQAMAAGSFHASFFTVAWPTGEFGAMGLEGAVRLGFKKELEATGSPEEQKALFDKMVAEAYKRGKALNMASHLEIDDVIDPVDSRKWILAGLKATNQGNLYKAGNRPSVDSW